MKFRTIWVDVNPYLGRTQPNVLVERPLLHGDAPKGGVFNTAEVARKGRYWVSSDLDSQEWSLVATDRWVRIPMFGVRTQEAGVPHIWSIGLERGMRYLAGFLTHHREPIEEVILALGNECHDCGQPGQPPEYSRAYVGVAFRVKE